MMCLSLLILWLAPMACGFDMIFQESPVQNSATRLVPDNPIEFVLSVFTIQPGRTRDSVFKPSSQVYHIPPNLISWSSNPDVWAWCEDIFLKGDGMTYNIKTNTYELLFYPSLIIPISDGLDYPEYNWPWRQVRNCTLPQCPGCFIGGLTYFAYRLRFLDDNNVLAFGRCQGYMQNFCEASSTCTNGQSVTNFKSIDPYSEVDMFRAVCKPCAPGTWNTCTDKIQSPYTTCSWNVPDFGTALSKIGNIWVVGATLPSMCAAGLKDPCIILNCLYAHSRHVLPVFCRNRSLPLQRYRLSAGSFPRFSCESRTYALLLLLHTANPSRIRRGMPGRSGQPHDLRPAKGAQQRLRRMHLHTWIVSRV